MVRQARTILADAIAPHRAAQPSIVTIPKDAVEIAFMLGGYGDEATKKWINSFIRAGIIKITRKDDVIYYTVDPFLLIQ